ncbi:MAG: D-alanine--D-alanine ligase, partial [Acidimicrobiales bacterium]
MAAAPRANLVLIYGGRSAEHEISCVSALHVSRAADRERYSLCAIGITTDGQWVDATGALAGTEDRLALPSPDSLPGASEGPGPVLTSLLPSSLKPGGDRPTVAVPMVHGPMGEDGTLQGLLELIGVPYTGAGVAGSAVSMDKALAKEVLAGAGIAQAVHVSVAATESPSSVAEQVEKRLGWPVFVKPANMGSSIGITCASGVGELEAALAAAARYDEWL